MLVLPQTEHPPGNFMLAAPSPLLFGFYQGGGIAHY